LLHGHYDEAAARMEFRAAVQEWRAGGGQAAGDGRTKSSTTSTHTAATKACSTVTGHVMCTQTASQPMMVMSDGLMAATAPSSYFCRILLGSQRHQGLGTGKGSTWGELPWALGEGEL
jgi:hypothetical protein